MNIALLLDAAAAMYPSRRAVEDGRRSLTYGELRDAAARRASWIAAEAAGGAVLYLGTARAEVVELMFASAVAGVPFVPVSYRLRPAEIEACVRIAAPGAIFVEARYAESVPATAARVVDADKDGTREGRPLDIADASGPAVCLFTSGTTSAPKLAVLTHDNLSSYVLNTVEAGSSSEHEAILITTPPYHIAGVANVLSNVFRARRIVLRAQFDATEWLEVVRAERITHAMVVPTMLARIVDALERRPDLAPTTLLNLAYGGARAPEGLVERALALLPPEVGLVNAFGLTETSSTIAMLGPEDHRAAMSSTDPAVRARLRSVGRPVPGVEVRIAREDGTEAAAGEVGQLWIRGSQVSPGYVGRAGGLDPDGWFHSGDRASVDAEGFLFAAGRSDDIVIRGGENIDPSEVEDVLARHPSVREAVVVGLPDAEWGQVLAALVVGDRSATEDELRAWVRSQVAGHKAPVIYRWADELPRNDMGKVVRARAESILADAQLEATR